MGAEAIKQLLMDIDLEKDAEELKKAACRYNRTKKD